MTYYVSSGTLNSTTGLANGYKMKAEWCCGAVRLRGLYTVPEKGRVSRPERLRAGWVVGAGSQQVTDIGLTD